MVVLGAIFVGIVSGGPWQSSEKPRAPDAGPSSAIEWNAVQAVPTRTLTPDEVEWEKRAAETSPLVGEAGRGPAASAAEENFASPPRNPPHEGEGQTGRLYVTDGDTFGIGSERIRILGLDAPETHPSRCAQEAQLGDAATAKLKELLASGTVTMSGSGHDRYGRELKQVFVNGADVAQTMIAAGLARSYDGGKKQGWC